MQSSAGVRASCTECVLALRRAFDWQCVVEEHAEEQHVPRQALQVALARAHEQQSTSLHTLRLACA